jgi:hypothetical protein
VDGTCGNYITPSFPPSKSRLPFPDPAASLPSIPTWFQSQASELLAGVVQHPRCLQLCSDRFQTTQHAEVQFWCAKTLLGKIEASWSAMGEDDHATCHGVLWQWLEHCVAKRMPSFVCNKVAQAFAFVASQQYPVPWSGLFSDLLALAGRGPEEVRTARYTIYDVLHVPPSGYLVNHES